MHLVVVFEPRAQFKVWRQLAERRLEILGIKFAARAHRSPRDGKKRHGLAKNKLIKL